MKTVAITGPQQAEIIEESEPSAHGQFAKVKIEVAPMCTEYKAYLKGSLGASLGHEAAGTVVEIDRDGPVNVGDRVVVMPTYPCGQCRYCRRGEYIHCRHGEPPLDAAGSPVGAATYAQYLLKNDWLLLRVPDHIDLVHASMACCGLGPTFGAMQYMRINSLDTVLILGLGPVGLGGVINGVARGARVLAVEGNSYRAKLARKLGAAHVFDPQEDHVLEEILDATDGVGVDGCVDCTGVPAAQRLGIEATRRLGTFCFVGEGAGVEVRASADMIRNGLTLRGIWHWSLADADEMFNLIGKVGNLLDLSVTHTFPLHQVQDAWDLQREGRCGKIVLKPWE